MLASCRGTASFWLKETEVRSNDHEWPSCLTSRECEAFSLPSKACFVVPAARCERGSPLHVPGKAQVALPAEELTADMTASSADGGGASG